MFKKWQKIFLSIFLPLSVGSLSVGFAAISDNLAINGIVTNVPLEEIFITNVSHGNESQGTSSKIAFSNTMISSTIDLGNNATNTVTHYITVFNNLADVENKYGYYAYSIPSSSEAGVDYYDNDDIKVIVYYDSDTSENENWVDLTSSGIPEQDAEGNVNTLIVPAKSSVTFKVVYSYVEGATLTNTKLNSSIIYNFALLSSFPKHQGAAATAACIAKFLEIMNDPTKDENGDTKANYILDAMQENSVIFGLGGDYVGNVTGAGDEHTKLIKELFGDALGLTINGKDEKVTMLIKRENIDGDRNTGLNAGSWFNGGQEMTLYMTTDTLQNTEENGRAVVFAIVFTIPRGESEWVQLSSVIEGTATVCAYDGTDSGTGSFNTNNWLDNSGATPEKGRTIENCLSDNLI